MNLLKEFFIWLFSTLFRFIPISGRTGLLTFGNPDAQSPVFVTGNFILTIQKVKKILKNLDCYLLVVNSKGINIWCAAAGGHLTHHQIISAIKTSGIDQLVSKKQLILPQLAAAGVWDKQITQKTGWKVIWGPVDIDDVPDFLQQNYQKTRSMAAVKFPLFSRIEMFFAMAFSLSMIALPVSYLFFPELLPFTLGCIWIFSLIIFLLFPFYKFLFQNRNSWLNIIKQMLFPIILWAAFIIFVHETNFLGLRATFSFANMALISFIVAVTISFDLRGTTPLFFSAVHPSHFQLYLDLKKCRGDGRCEEVCPRNCHLVDRKNHTSKLQNLEQCLLCGACVIQCPFDALDFRGKNGFQLSPADVRQQRLNLMGKRKKKI